MQLHYQHHCQFLQPVEALRLRSQWMRAELQQLSQRLAMLNMILNGSRNRSCLVIDEDTRAIAGQVESSYPRQEGMREFRETAPTFLYKFGRGCTCRFGEKVLGNGGLLERHRLLH